MRRIHPLAAGAVLFLAAAVFLALPLSRVTTAAQLDPGERLDTAPRGLILLDEVSEAAPFVPPPEQYTRNAPQTANIVVNYIGGWDAQAQAAFEYAVGIWETLVSSPVPIYVDAEWSPLGPGILGGAGARTSHRDFSGAPVPNTWYPAALANSLAGTDLNPGFADIGAEFSSSYSNWYFGTDGNPGSQIDFASVVLHEVGHGLGFFGSMQVSSTTGLGSWGSGTIYPYIYDRFTENGAGDSLINTSLFPNQSAALAAQLTSNNVYFDGPNGNAANGGGRVKLYAPGTWQQGSSYSHLDEIFNGTANALMTYSIPPGEANHNPGPVTLGMFTDMGWGGSPNPPTATPTRTPTVTLTPTITPTKTPFPPFTPVAWNYLPYAARNHTGPIPSATPTQTPSRGIYGQAAVNGVPTGGIALALRFWNGVGWSTWGTAQTDAAGDFSFIGAPSLSAGQRYYVHYQNENSDPGRLWGWSTRHLTSYTAGTEVFIGNFDLGDVTLVAPPDGSFIDLPYTFQWNVRSSTPTDSYELDLYDSTDGNPSWWTDPALGYTGSYTLNSLPPGFTTNTEYTWEVWVYSPDGGFGISYEFYAVTFTSAGLAAERSPQPPGPRPWLDEAGPRPGR
jgi:hypothetical protein